jgi:signal transduction histidine kinase
MFAALLSVLVEAEVWWVGLHPRAVAAAAGFAATIALGWRRRAPLASTGVVFGAVAAESFAGVSLQHANIPLLVGLVSSYTVAAYRPWRPALVGLAFAACGIWAAVDGQPGTHLSDYVFALIVVASGWLVGRGMRGHVTRADVSEERAAHEAEQAVIQERTRIARELHDVIAHSLSVMVVQAGAAEERFSRDPGGVLEPLRAIQETGRQALAEMGHLLGLLRSDSAEIGLAPQPGLEDLDRLLAQTREAGLQVDLRVEGTPRPLPIGIDLSAFRIVQEALTNTRKHSHAARAEIVVRYRDAGVDIEVVDRGRPRVDGHLPTGGHGLVGMRERVAVFGGALEAGPTSPNGGFRVRAHFPLAGAFA